MYRILSASKDSYITNKYVGGERCETSNVGQAGTLDLYKLYDETTIVGVTSSIVEMSRLLVKVDYSSLSTFDYSNPSFSCFLHLKDVYGGQTTPSNFTIEMFPLSKSFDEGRGSDVVGLRDVDTCNWLSASATTPWVSPGAGATGSLGGTLDALTDVGLFEQTFERGDEDLLIDITSHVSASLAGIIQNHGFRIGLSSSLEEDTNTYFVKRFGSKQAYDKHLQPRLVVKTSSDILEDSMGFPLFNVSQSLFVYNQVNGVYSNFISGSTSLSGQDCLLLKLEASKSFTYTTSSWSTSHSASINHLTRSVASWSTQYSGSQVTSSFGVGIPGTYKSDMFVSTFDSSLRDYLSGSTALELKVTWTSLDSSVVYAEDWAYFNNLQGGFGNIQPKNWVINITNLQQTYSKNVTTPARFRLFIQNYDLTNALTKLPSRTPSQIVKNMKWRLIEAYTKKVVIPFDPCTRLSFDRDGMYFDIWTSDLDLNQVYQIDFLNDVDNSLTPSEQTLFQNSAFKFKIVN